MDVGEHVGNCNISLAWIWLTQKIRVD